MSLQLADLFQELCNLCRCLHRHFRPRLVVGYSQRVCYTSQLKNEYILTSLP